MKKYSPVIENQIDEFIKFINGICSNPPTGGLTDENKKELRESFYTLIHIAQTDVIHNIAVYLKDLTQDK